MMKYALILTTSVLILACLAGPTHASDPWSTYTTIRDKYFAVDKQSFQSISCKIDAPAINGIVRNILTKIPPGGVSIQHNLQDFSLTFDKAEGVFVVVPSLSIDITTPNKFADLAAAQQGIEEIQDVFSTTANGIREIIASVFEDIASPKKEKIKNLFVTTKDGVTTAKYQKSEDIKVEETLSANTIQMKMTTPSMTAEAVELFSSAEDKLVMTKSHFKSQGINASLQISYQNLGPLLFPSQVSSDTEIDIDQTTQQKAHISFNLHDCRVIK